MELSRFYHVGFLQSEIQKKQALQHEIEIKLGVRRVQSGRVRTLKTRVRTSPLSSTNSSGWGLLASPIESGAARNVISRASHVYGCGVRT